MSQPQTMLTVLTQTPPFISGNRAWEEYVQVVVAKGDEIPGKGDPEKCAQQRLLGSLIMYQPIDKLIASAELRRDRIFAQLEFHVAQRLREAAKMVESNLDKPKLAAA